MRSLFLFLALCLMGMYIPGSGGSGVALPYNLLLIGWSGLVLLTLTFIKKSHALRAERQPLVTIGCLLLLLPWLIQARGNPGVWGLLAALILWLWLLLQSFGPQQKQWILSAIFVLAICQCAISIIQVFFPALAVRWFEFDWLRNHGRPYGIFQQVNLLASFLATGLGCGFLLLMRETRRHYTFVLIAGLGLLAFCLTLSQSRAGAIGAGSIVAILIVIQGWKSPRRIVIAIAAMAFCVAAGWYITHHVQIWVNGQPYLLAREYGTSTHERWHILTISWQMILQKPWFGWGYGTFEYQFSRYVLAHPELPYTYSSIVTHPHNELIYAWFQGGITAVTGVVTLFFGWMVMVIRAVRRSRLAVGYTMLIVPLLVHLNLEYPFYQSFIHLALFIVLLRLGCAEIAQPETRAALYPARVGYVVSGMALLAFSVTGLYANRQLTTLERNGFSGFPVPAPWYFASQFERADFDAMVARLIRYNQSRDESELDRFMQQAQRWSLRHNDKNVWLSMMMIARYRGETEKALQMQALYRRLFPLQQ